MSEENFVTPSLMDTPPVRTALSWLSEFGWWLVGGGVLAIWLGTALRPHLQRWREAREDAEHHKNPDLLLARMEAMQRARERQQQLLEQQSQLAKERQKEREERKRAEVAALLAGRGGAAAGGSRLGVAEDYLPLSGAGGSGYRPPKKSKCGGGGCGQ